MHPELFTARLRQVIQWTEHLAAGFDFAHGDYGLVFRQTNPLIDGQPLYHLQPAGNWYAGTRASMAVADRCFSFAGYQAALRAALARRVAELKPPAAPPDMAALLGQGRILGFETQLSTYDGAPIVESQGFVDEGDVPPIDTWFYLREQVPGFEFPILYCWIPQGFEALMEHTRAIEILDSYHWLDEADPALYARVQALL